MKIAREKILIRGVNWLGDAVMTTPALMRLREAKPDAQITLLTHEKLAGLWRGHPSIDTVLTFAKDESAWQIGQKLRRGKFDVGLALPNSHRSALELWFAGIPQRIGYARFGRNLFLTKAIVPRDGAVEMHKRSVAEIKDLIEGRRTKTTDSLPAKAHHIFQYLHLVAALGAKPEALEPRIEISENEVSQFRGRLNKICPDENPIWLGLNPGAEYGPAKRWPAERFISAAVELHQKTKCSWIIFGVKETATQQIAAELEKIIGKQYVVNLAGETTLRELCAGLKFCQLVLTNDTGPMHVAAALGTPVIVPFGSTSAELTGPTFSERNALLKAKVPCSPCFLRECPIDFRCMDSIGVEQVVSAALAVLKRL